MTDSAETQPKDWKALAELQEPFNDAVNYKTRQQKEFFSRIFLRTDDLVECLKPAVYYLIGEKGSGKTAYAAFLENNETNDTRCKLSTMTETQYKRFIALKRNGQLAYSDYANIWRPMLLVMVSQALVQKSKGFVETITGKFSEIEREIERFDAGALNPEVEVAFEVVRDSNAELSIGNSKFGKYGEKESERTTEKVENIRHGLLAKETTLKTAIAELNLPKHHVLFIDGIDYRPEEVPYKDYLACVKGLGEAVWQLNTEFFANIRDSRGRIKIVLLVRPDVFHALNLYNSNSKLRDNSVLLDWSTTEQGLRNSALYEATGKFFASQQSFSVTSADAADNYLRSNDEHAMFKRLLRTTFQKPRDVLTFIRTARSVVVKKMNHGNATQFPADIMRNPDYTREYADYLLGEVRNYAAFYMEQEDFFLYMKFFQYLDGKGEFDFGEFKSAFERFRSWIRGETVTATDYLRDAEALLQFFYDVNIVGYREMVGDDARFVHFSFRERTLTNLAPKVKLSGTTLVVNPGVAKALDIGLRVKRGEPPPEGQRRRQPRGGARGLPKQQGKRPPGNHSRKG